MEIAEAQKFLADHHRGVLVARKRDGWPQITLVTPVIDPEGRVILHSRADAFKVRNIGRDPRVSLLVMGEDFSGSKYVQVHGTGRAPELAGVSRQNEEGRPGGHPDRHRKGEPEPGSQAVIALRPHAGFIAFWISRTISGQ
jgi:hypothetical protein